METTTNEAIKTYIKTYIKNHNKIVLEIKDINELLYDGRRITAAELKGTTGGKEIIKKIQERFDVNSRRLQKFQAYCLSKA